MFWKVVFWESLSKTLSVFAIHPTWYLSMRFRWWHVGAEIVGYIGQNWLALPRYLLTSVRINNRISPISINGIFNTCRCKQLSCCIKEKINNALSLILGIYWQFLWASTISLLSTPLPKCTWFNPCHAPKIEAANLSCLGSCCYTESRLFTPLNGYCLHAGGVKKWLHGSRSLAKKNGSHEWIVRCFAPFCLHIHYLWLVSFEPSNGCKCCNKWHRPTRIHAQ